MKFSTNNIARYFGLDGNYLASGTFWMGMDQTINVATSFVTTVVMTRLVSKETYGAYAYLMGVFMFVLPLTLPGVSNAIIQSVARGHEGVLRRGVGQRLMGGFITTLVLVFIAVFFYVDERYDIAWATLMVCVLYPFAFAADDYKSFLHGRQEFSRYAWINGAANVLVCASTVAAVLWSRTLPVILAANVASRGVANIAAYFLVQAGRKNDSVDAEFQGNSRNLSIVAAINGISFSIDQVLVGSIYPLEIMATYGLATRLSEPFRFLSIVANRLAWPKAARMTGPGVAGKFLSKLLLLLVALAASSVLILALMPPLINFLFPSYRDAVPLTEIMIVSAMLSVVVTYLETYFISQDHLRRFYYFASTARPILTILAMPLFIKFWGFWGAIYARLLIRTLASVVLTHRMVKEWKRNPKTETAAT